MQPVKKISFLLCLLSSIFIPLCQATTTQNCPTLSGLVIDKNHSTYNQARMISNYYQGKNRFPYAIVYTLNEEDVQHAMQYARCHKIPVRIRSGGHNHEGFSTGDGVIIIDVSKMKQLKIDKENKIITVQPGMTGGELYKNLTDVGLTQVGGTCSGVGISGLMLSGGMGPMIRKHGMACDNLISLNIVDANAKLLHVTKTNEYKDLFWASCGGGGGNFGVVTEMTINVYPAPSVTWFNIGWDWNQPIEKVISTWQDLFATDNDKWFSHLDIWAKAFPVKKFHKQPVKVMGVFWGTPDEAKLALQPLLKIGHPADTTIQFVDWESAIKSFEDATAVFITDKPEYKSSGSYAMQSLPENAIKIITTTLRNTHSTLFNVLLFSMGGASKHRSPTDTAYFYREAKFFLQYSNQWLQAKNDKLQIAETDTLRNKLLPYTQGDYIGNPDRNLSDYMTTYYGGNVAKLRCLKRKYDANNIFQFEQSILPAPLDWKCS